MSNKQKFKCPVCQRDTWKLIDIKDPGKQYKQCCRECVWVAKLITRNYPYSENWYSRIDKSIFRLIASTQNSPVHINSGIYFEKNARDFLRAIKQLLISNLIDFIKKEAVIHLVVASSKMHSRLSDLIKKPSLLKEASTNLMDITEIDDPQDIAIFLMGIVSYLRFSTISLIRYALAFGAKDTEPKYFSEEKLIKALRYTYYIDLVSDLDDGIYYQEYVGIRIENNRVVAIDRREDDPISIGEVGFSFLSSMENKDSKEAEQFALNVKNEFYSVVLNMNDVLQEELGISGKELLDCYLKIAQFADRHESSTFVITPHEFRLLLRSILPNTDSSKQSAIFRTLFYENAENIPAHYEQAHFYNPIFQVPVGGYYFFVLSATIIDHARMDFFYDLAYGVHPLVVKNPKIQKSYGKLKQEYITGPFERRISDLFVSYGWTVLTNSEGGIRVGEKTLAVIPKDVGEIDLLALDSQGQKLVVCDCKYLFDYGAIAKEVRSLSKRFIEEYIPQVMRKKKWVENNIEPILTKMGSSINGDLSIVPMIVTRNPLPVKMSESNILVLSSFELEKWFESE